MNKEVFAAVEESRNKIMYLEQQIQQEKEKLHDYRDSDD